ncbi:MAG: hypothetical protein FWB73_07955 [Treponema sp.]|nr:hypothetical protein [Treponema sp.]
MILFLGFLFMIFFFAVIGVSSRAFAISMLINLPALFLILIPMLFFLLVTKSGKIIGKYISTSFKKNYAYSIIELEQLSSAIKNTIKFILAAGGFCFMAFVVISLGYIGSPEQLGPNLSNCLLSLTYAVVISYFIFFPVQAWAENKLKSFKNLE